MNRYVYPVYDRPRAFYELQVYAGLIFTYENPDYKVKHVCELLDQFWMLYQWEGVTKERRVWKTLQQDNDGPEYYTILCEEYIRYRYLHE